MSFKTIQEAFDATVQHLAKQKRRAVGGVRCSYRTAENLACAIGCHIPDGHPALSSPSGVKTLLEEYPDVMEYLKIDEIIETDRLLHFWGEIQGAHDFATGVYWLKLSLEQLRVEWQLDQSKINLITEWS